MLEKILIATLFLMAACVGYTTYTVHNMNAARVIAIDCNRGEEPRACQSRLGSQFEVLYNAATGETWAELK